MMLDDWLYDDNATISNVSLLDTVLYNDSVDNYNDSDYSYYNINIVNTTVNSDGDDEDNDVVTTVVISIILGLMILITIIGKF